MRQLLFILSFFMWLQSDSCALAAPNPAGQSGAGPVEQRSAPPAEPAPEMAPPGQDAAKDGKEPSAKPTELDLLQDPTVKVEVEPVVASSVVDRVIEPGTVIVRCPDALTAEVFLVPVDAPYGGKPLDIPRSIGKGTKTANVFKIRWTSKEPDQYVKLFAVVRRKSSPERRVRSHTIDLAIGGSRYVPDSANDAR